MRFGGLTVLLTGAVLLAGCSLGGEDSPQRSSGPGSFVMENCTRGDLGGQSVARVWDEAILRAIRRDTPAPTVHARNLFHVSAAMWDAWAAYDPVATGYFTDEKAQARDVQAAREAAISYAAYRLLLHRYSYAAGLQETFDDLVATMRSLCYRIDYVATDGGSPAALGNWIAERVIAYGQKDGAREDLRYADPTYKAANPPLVVEEPGAGDMRDPSHWQPLALARAVSQNGIPIPGKVQQIIGAAWGHVAGFALPDPGEEGLPMDPGPAPVAGDAEFRQEALDVIRFSSRLDPGDGATLDIGPGAMGGNTLGTNDGHGHEVNPATGEPYAGNVVRRGDFARALAEYWADGPKSETPPGHWNVLANEASDAGAEEGPLRIGGTGPEVDRLEWDVKLYFALNAAVHDAAVAAWGAKRYYDTARPISMIRYMGAKGQSSDPRLRSYDPGGLPLAKGMVELVTPASSAPGGRHANLKGHVGEVAIRAWSGFPDDPATEASGVGWIRAVDWVPYQLPTFVTPAFPGYVSGHSTFSRAAAEVLTGFTGSSYFPGGVHDTPVPSGALKVEQGPSRDIVLQWATYFDAADAAGISRIYMGIHVPPDDFGGRIVGSACGKAAWKKAQLYYSGAV